MSGDRLAHLSRVAEAADDGGREWEWSGGYPQTVTRTGDVILIANTFEDPDSPARLAEFIATFDPPTVLALLDRLNAAAVLIERMETTDMRRCLNVHGDMLCDGPQGHEGGCVFVPGWMLARKIEDELTKIVAYAGATTNELRETRADRDEGWRQHNRAVSLAATVIERMANGASRQECDPELSELIALIADSPPDRGEYHAEGLDERGIYGGRAYPDGGGAK